MRRPTTEADIFQIAKRLQIKIVEVPCRTREVTYRVRKQPGTSRGPRGHAIDLRNRTFFLERGGWPDTSLEILLHEIAHVYTQPPFWPISGTPEEFLLMPWERAVARACFDPKTYRNVVDWQLSTGIYYLPGETLESVRAIGDYSYSHAGWWRAGFIALRKLGMLDVDNRPTWRQPRWNRFNRKLQRQFWDMYHISDEANLDPLTLARQL